MIPTHRRYIWVFALLGVLPAGAMAQAGAAAVERAAVDGTFHARLEALAERCRQLGLQAESEATLAFVVSRVPQRTYYFYPSPASWDGSRREFDKNNVANKAVDFWWKHFRQTRIEYAAALFEHAKEQVETDPSATYRTLFEVCWLDPDHVLARKVLGYTLDGEHQWRRGNDQISVAKGGLALKDYGFAARKYWRVSSEHFSIVTDLDEAKGRELAEQLEQFYLVWHQAFFDYWGQGATLQRRLEKGLAPPRRTRKRHIVVYFRDRAEYVGRLQVFEPMIEKTIGFYQASRRRAFLYDAPVQPVKTWRHEVGHQLFAETLNARPQVGERNDFWIVEALALYLESFDPHGHYATLGGPVADRLQFARYRAIREGFRVPIAEMTQWGRRDVQQHARLGALYSQFAGIAHFMMDDSTGAYRRPLIEYARDAYRNGEPERALLDYLGDSAAGLDQKYIAHLHVTDGTLSEADRPESLCLTQSTVTLAGLKKVDFSRLEWLDLSDTEVGDAALPLIAKASRLEQLSLERANFSAECLPVIGTLHALREIELTGISLDRASLGPLSKLGRLGGLWLGGTGIGDEQLPALYGLRSLETLDITGCNVSSAAVAELKRRLPNATVQGP